MMTAKRACKEESWLEMYRIYVEFWFGGQSELSKGFKMRIHE